MNSKGRVRLAFFVLLLYFQYPVMGYSQNKLGAECIGAIRSDTSNDNSNFLGSGFAIDSNIVVTCYHVFTAKHEKPKYFISLTNTVVPITLFDSIPVYDIVRYKTSYAITKRPMQLLGFENISVGDTIYFGGFDFRVKKILVDRGIVTVKYSVDSNNTEIKMFKFAGIPIPGYSGGPIFNQTGSVVGFIDMAIPRPADGVIIGGIGFSVEPLMGNRKNVDGKR